MMAAVNAMIGVTHVTPVTHAQVTETTAADGLSQEDNSKN